MKYHIDAIRFKSLKNNNRNWESPDIQMQKISNGSLRILDTKEGKSFYEPMRCNAPTQFSTYDWGYLEFHDKSTRLNLKVKSKPALIRALRKLSTHSNAKELIVLKIFRSIDTLLILLKISNYLNLLLKRIIETI